MAVPLYNIQNIFKLPRNFFAVAAFPKNDFVLPENQAVGQIVHLKLEIILDLLFTVVIADISLDDFAGDAEFRRDELAFCLHSISC